MDKTSVRDRLSAKGQEGDLRYGVPCTCNTNGCTCRVRHRWNAICPLCRDGDHYKNLASYLVQVEARRIG